MPKRRQNRAPPAQPKEKLFCPRTMVRYDGSHKDYPTKWVCKMCLKVLLSEQAVRNHLVTCIELARPTDPAPPRNEETPRDTLDTPHICKYCNKVFSRGVTLKRHLEVHEKPPEHTEYTEYTEYT